MCRAEPSANVHSVNRWGQVASAEPNASACLRGPRADQSRSSSARMPPTAAVSVFPVVAAQEARKSHRGSNTSHEVRGGQSTGCCDDSGRGHDPVWSKYSDAQRVNSLHLSKDRLNPPSRSDTYSSSAEGVVRGWNTMVSYISGSVDEELLLRNE